MLTNEDAYFKRQHALITGGGSGIGAAVAEALAACGVRLTLLGRNAERLEARAKQLGAARQVADVTSKEAIDAAFARARETSGAVTILINNAGTAESAPFARTSADLWQRMLAVNLTGVFNCTQAALPDMESANHGRIINIASTAALVGYKYVAAYCAAKHGVIGLTRSLALETARKGITVNAVCPGYTDTELVARSIEKIAQATGRSREAARAELVSVNPQKRLIDPAEVAATVRWLCSSAAGSVTGQAIAVAGGEVM